MNIHPKLLIILDDEDRYLLGDYNWCLNGGYAFTREYVKNYKKGEKRKYIVVPIFLHRLVMNAVKGDIVDHINRNKLDNRRCNLRLVSSLENNMNRANLSHKKYKGVFWHKRKNKFCAQLGVSNKRIWLGTFTDEIEAAKAYDKAANEIYGKFCYLNFP